MVNNFPLCRLFLPNSYFFQTMEDIFESPKHLLPNSQDDDDDDDDFDEEVVCKQPSLDKGSKQKSGLDLGTCKVLQRKLELKAERSRHNFSKTYVDYEPREKKSTSLIPLERLPIPQRPEQQPLVDYKSSDISDDEGNFFPIKLGPDRRYELSDTFSLHEMTIETDDEERAQNLELKFSDPTNSWLDRLKSWSCC